MHVQSAVCTSNQLYARPISCMHVQSAVCTSNAFNLKIYKYRIYTEFILFGDYLDSASLFLMLHGHTTYFNLSILSLHPCS